MAALGREDLIDGLRELLARLATRRVTGRIQVVGGAALSLAYFDRDTTVDIDARLRLSVDISDVVAEIAHSRDWPTDWLNDAAAGFIPAWGKDVEWAVALQEGEVSVEIASADALLAMKLRANRPGRDNRDIAQLLALCRVTTLAGAEEIYGSFYPGDALDPRAIRMVERALEVGLPDPAVRPEPFGEAPVPSGLD